MKLYVILQCPYVQRVLLGLLVRQISPQDLPTESIDLSKPPAAMLAINPNGSVPTLELGPNDGFNESLVINEFLDTLPANGPKLYGNTPVQIAKTKVLFENLNEKLLNALLQIVYVRGNELQFRKGQAGIKAAFADFEEFLKKTEGPFFGGNELNAIDCALAPFIARYVLAREVRNEIPLPATGTRAEAYFAAITGHPFVKQTNAPDLMDVIKRFIFPEEGVIAVQKASRLLVDAPEQRLAQLNLRAFATNAHTQSEANPIWSLGMATKGPFLHARFKFRDVNDALSAIQTIAQIQESADHHTGLTFQDYTSLDLSVCTHEPRWGVSEKDFALAAILTEKLLQPQA